MKRPVPEHGPCFVCGSSNPSGIGLTWYDEDGVISSEFTLCEAQQGPPGYAHGGASAAILDEAMGAAVWRAGYDVAVVNLEIHYRHPLPLNQPLTCTAQLDNKNGRKIHAVGEIHLPDGELAVSGSGLYVEAPQLFGSARFRD
jgi:acyl-coenzyme A thioesterase PaaI-like protein